VNPSRRLFVCVASLVSLVLLVWLAPRVLALYYQGQAGDWLGRVQRGAEGDAVDAWDLPRIPATNAKGQSQIAQAVSDLQSSLQYNPDDSHSYLLLGRAYRLAGQLDQSIQAYRTYANLRPKNPLGHLELGFAYEALCKSQAGEAAARCPAAIAEWQAGGFSSVQALARGDEALGQSRMLEALVWYERYQWFADSNAEAPPLPFELVFRLAVAAASVQNPDARQLLAEVRERDATFQVYSVEPSARIDGTAFRWVSPNGGEVACGTPLSNGGSGSAGFLWWTGQATALISVEQAGDYLVRTRVRHSDPPPVEMAIGVDGKQLEPITLARGDDSWETVSLPVTLAAGYHTVDIWYLNNAIVNGQDRDAAVEWVEIERQVSHSDQ
jgi:tetratricopeptide (TPR) repeat protein